VSHLDTFHAIRYRGIDGLRLDRLGKVNLITGPNGVGKTSLAEAVWLSTAASRRSSPGTPSCNARRTPPSTRWRR